MIIWNDWIITYSFHVVLSNDEVSKYGSTFQTTFKLHAVLRGVENNQQDITLTGRILLNDNNYSPTLPMEKVISVYEASQQDTIILGLKKVITFLNFNCTIQNV